MSTAARIEATQAPATPPRGPWVKCLCHWEPSAQDRAMGRLRAGLCVVTGEPINDRVWQCCHAEHLPANRES